MQAGATAETEVMSLFHDDAVYEPFTGPVLNYSGKQAIRAYLFEDRGGPVPSRVLRALHAD